ncbi:MAG: hypothetical protein H6745_08400 [Deltaproteobacteria bacterium]|nr:hypothetical protein [Deltaproteobacteria bacterium]
MQRSARGATPAAPERESLRADPARRAPRALPDAGFAREAAALAPGGAVDAGRAPVQLMASGGAPVQMSAINLGRGHTLGGGGFSKWSSLAEQSAEGGDSKAHSLGISDKAYDFGDMNERLDDAKERRDNGEAPDPQNGDVRDGDEIVGIGTAIAAESTRTKGPEDRAKSNSDASIHGGAAVEAASYTSGKDADWTKGDKIGAGGRAEAFAGARTGAHVSAERDLGPRLGGIDPRTGERGNMLHAATQAGADASIGVKGATQGEAYAEGLSAGAAGEANVSALAELGINGAAGAGIDVGGYQIVDAGIGVDAHADAGAAGGAEGEVRASLAGGLLARGAAEAHAGASADVEGAGRLAVGGLGLSGKIGADAFAGARAGATGQVAVGLSSIGVAGGVEAFAGARAQLHGGAALDLNGVDAIGFDVTGTAAAGAGGSAGGGFMIRDGVLTIDAHLMGAVGVGCGLSGSFHIDFLSPFKAAIGLLEQNGVISSNPDTWIMEIIEDVKMGGAKVGERMAGRPEAADDVDETRVDRSQVVGGGRFEQSEVVQAKAAPGGAPAGFGSTTGAAAAQSDVAPLSSALPAPPALLSAAGPGAAKAADGSIDVATATEKLRGVHAGMGAVQDLFLPTLTQAMSALSARLAKPAELIQAILAGAAQAIVSMAPAGARSALRFGKELLSAASSVVKYVAELVFSFFSALFGGKVNDYVSGYDGKAAKLKQENDLALGEFQSQIGAIADEQKASLRQGITGALKAIASSFASESLAGTEKAEVQAAEAQKVMAELAVTPIRRADGTTAMLRPEAKAEVDEVVSTVRGVKGAPAEAQGRIEGGAGQASEMLSAKVDKDAGKATGDVATSMNGQFAAAKEKADASVKKQKQAG